MSSALTLLIECAIFAIPAGEFSLRTAASFFPFSVLDCDLSLSAGQLPGAVACALGRVAKWVVVGALPLVARVEEIDVDAEEADAPAGSSAAPVAPAAPAAAVTLVAAPPASALAAAAAVVADAETSALFLWHSARWIGAADAAAAGRGPSGRAATLATAAK